MMLRAMISVALLASALIFIAYNSGLDTVVESLLRLPSVSIGLVVLFLLAGCLLAALRLKFAASDLGYRLTFRESLAAMSIGQLAGSIFFQLAGQLIGRSWFLAQRNVPAAATVMVTGYERIAALAVSLIFATAGGFYIFGRITVNLEAGGANFLKLLAGLALTVASGTIFAWGDRAFGKIALHSRMLVSILRNVGVSAAIQITTMAAYFVAARALAAAIPGADLMAASAVVMLSASLPISFGGWGLREISAIFVLGTVGLRSSDAFTVALLIGTVSIALVAVLAFTTTEFWTRRPIKVQQAAIDHNLAMRWALPLMAATAVLFQIYVPFRNGVLNVNLADPLAILGGALFLLALWRDRRLPAWRFARVNLYLAVITFVITTALLIGASRFGFTAWALTNRFSGWFVLLGFVATGALIVRTAGMEGLQILLKTFVAAAAAIVLLEVAIEIAQNAGLRISGLAVNYVREGFAQNRNAFAFQLVMAAAAAFASMNGRTRIAFLSIVMLGLWLAGSRAGWGATAIMLAFGAIIGAASWREIAGAMLLTAALIALTVALTIALSVVVAPSGAEIFSLLLSAFPKARIVLPEAHSTAERLYSFAAGWRMFLNHPLFGAGLGAFMQSELSSAGRPLVIHSTPLWLLAEFGVLGFLAFAAPACAILLQEMRNTSRDAASIFILLSFAGFSTMALVHDVLYQRSLWLLLGAALALIPLRHGGRASSG